jgi:hypothetical protein
MTCPESTGGRTESLFCDRIGKDVTVIFTGVSSQPVCDHFRKGLLQHFFAPTCTMRTGKPGNPNCPFHSWPPSG